MFFFVDQRKNEDYVKTKSPRIGYSFVEIIQIINLIVDDDITRIITSTFVVIQLSTNEDDQQNKDNSLIKRDSFSFSKFI